MTILSNKDRDRILSNGFVLDFLDAKLTQRKDVSPVIYKGSASLIQSSDGVFQLKLYHRFESPSEFQREMAVAWGPDLEVGRIIGEEHYFDFEGTDMYGASWRSPRIWIRGDVSVPANGRVVAADLRFIESEADIEGAKAGGVCKAVAVVRGEFAIPYNGMETMGNSTTRSICELEVADQRCTVRKREGYIVLTLEQRDTQSELPDVDGVLEGLSFSLGRRLRPKIVTLMSAGSQSQRIYSDAPRAIQPSLPQPIPTRSPADAKALEHLLDRYVSAMPQKNAALFGFWYRVLTSFSSGVENRALVLTTAIEGVLKAYFPGLGKPDGEFAGQAAVAIPVLQSLEIGQRVKERVLASMRSAAKNPSAKGALHALHERGMVSSQLITCWKGLRNKAAHAEELQLGDLELQAHLDDFHSCLELFYRLAFAHIDYSGTMLAHSQPGWPEKPVRQ